MEARRPGLGGMVIYVRRLYMMSNLFEKDKKKKKGRRRAVEIFVE
jgi:hypothetical protein